jgi:RNA polymerase sigma-70 factor (ECF subfamily)
LELTAMLVIPTALVPRPRKSSQRLSIVKPDLTSEARAERAAAAGAASGDTRDRALIARITHADRAALKELYLLYHRRLARFLTRVTSRYDLAEEIINDTFWVVWQRAGDFRGASNVSTWIMGIAYRRGLKSLKRASVMQATANDVAAEAAQSEEPWSGAELREWLDVALARLPAEQRLVLELAYHMGHSCEEIALIMSCPVNTVKTRMFHARKKLKLLLPQLAGVDEEETQT